ncbi:TetR/AcrR family transcriptional regulator [Streptomyces sp. NBC_00199]|uniref:TetR/AcrR family transcriptional regulator n=1 Tax=Streptomyces sp. NBC_00199 TaxID=2975678 RepID=UPI00225592C2|nr:TetR/AcrR family transcriptional regulator [Streptomyces sp. NBC_00199]MCX5267571.1 TetR family transcriptional regulator C-terminal domain-containing protein [Streptomyces sp. NBC_00199]
MLRAAIEQIEARGVAAVRIADVAASLGVSNALVLYHFSTKERLVADAFARAAQDDLAHLRKLVGRRTTALRRLRSAVRWYAPTGQAKGWRLWIEGWAVSLREPALREVARHLDREWKAALAGVIAEGVAAGEFRCPDPAGTALRLTALLDGLAVQLTSYAGAVSRTRAQQWVDEALTRELGLPTDTSGTADTAGTAAPSGAPDASDPSDVAGPSGASSVSGTQGL